MLIILLIVVVTEENEMKLNKSKKVHGLSKWFIIIIIGRPRNPTDPRSPLRPTHSPVVPIGCGNDPTDAWDPPPSTSSSQSYPLSPYDVATIPIGSQCDPPPRHAIASFASGTPTWDSPPPPNPGTRQRASSQFDRIDASAPRPCLPSPPRSPTRPRVEHPNDPLTRFQSPRWRRRTKSRPRSPTRAGLRATPPTTRQG